MTFWESVASYTFWGNTPVQYFVALCAFVLIYILVGVFVVKIEKGLKRLIGSKKSHITYVVLRSVISIPPYFLRAIIVYFPLQLLSLNENVAHFLDVGFFTLFIIQVIRFSNDVMDYVVLSLMTPNGHITKTNKYMISMIVKAFVWIIGCAILLMNLGVEISPLLASLGIGGIAIAFALQNLLADVFASFSIFFDKPFKVGDFIQLKEGSGTVERISLKSTRIKTIDGQELILPNKKVVESPINNFSGIEKRRVMQHFSIVYETAPSLLKKIPDIVKSIVESLGDDYDFKWMIFKDYSTYSLEFQLVYYVYSDSMTSYLQKMEVVNYIIFEQFAQHGIRFAYLNPSASRPSVLTEESLS